MKKDVKFFVLIVIMLVASGLATTYGYYMANVMYKQNETLTIASGDLRVEYMDGTVISKENILPGWSGTKYFTIDYINTLNSLYSVDINLEVDKSNFYTRPSSVDNQALFEGTSYLNYSLYTCESFKTNCNNVLVSNDLLDVQSGNKKVYTVNFSDSSTVYYAFVLSFLNNPSLTQTQYGTDGELLNFSGYVTVS